MPPINPMPHSGHLLTRWWRKGRTLPPPFFVYRVEDFVRALSLSSPHYAQGFPLWPQLCTGMSYSLAIGNASIAPTLNGDFAHGEVHRNMGLILSLGL